MTTRFEQVCEAICRFPAVRSDPSTTQLIRMLDGVLAPWIAQGRIHGKPMSLAVGLVENLNLNGWAHTEGDEDFIGINGGTVPILVNVFRLLLADRSIMPMLGDPAIAQPPLTFSGVPRDLAKFSPANEFPPLADRAREARASELTYLALIYLAHHELAHIFNGHTSWMRVRGRMSLSELPLAHEKAFAGLERQTLEFDADASATQELLRFVLRANQDAATRPAKWFLPPSNPLGSVEEAISAVSIVVTTVHALFSSIDDLHDERALIRVHPPALVRQIYNSNMIQRTLTVRSGMDAEVVATIVFDAANATMGRLIRACGKEPRAVTAETWAKANSFIESYLDCWTKLRPLLDPLKRGGILAPIRTRSPT